VRVAAVLEPVPDLHKPRSAIYIWGEIGIKTDPSIHLSIYLFTRSDTRVTRRWHLLGLDGDSAGALGRGGEPVGERLQHGTVGDAVVELLQARLHLRHFGRQEPERRRSVVRWPPHQLLSTAVLRCSSGEVRWVDWMGSTQGEAGGRRLPVSGDWRCLNDLAPDWGCSSSRLALAWLVGTLSLPLRHIKKQKSSVPNKRQLDHGFTENS
jgi:hypothetical protein